MTPAAARARLTARTLGALGLLTAALPFSLAATGTALVRTAFVPEPIATPQRRRTVLISGGKMTKALQLCRSFHVAGHRVVLVEAAKYRLTGHRFSRAVDAFHVVPPPTDDGYAEALLEIVRAEDVDLYVPVCSPVASWYDARAAELLAGECEVLHADADTVRVLDDKHEFAARARELGLAVPPTYRVSSADEVEEFAVAGPDAPYVLKNLAYDPVNRLDLTPLPRPRAGGTAAFAATKPITRESPWIVQSFVSGQEYCTHSTVRDGRVVVYACCESSAFQVNYKMVDQPAIAEWVRRFVGSLGLTGQVSFDFIVDRSGRPVAIECNPRTHSAITLFHDTPGLADAYLGERASGGPLTPRPGGRPTYWLYHELWRMLSDPRHALQRSAVIRRGKDAIFDWSDPLPFLVLHHVQIPLLLVHNLVHGREWTRIDFNIGKLVEPGGD